MGLGLFAILNEGRKSLTEKGIPEKKSSRRGGRELRGLLRESVSSSENSQCKGPEAGVCLIRIEESKKASVSTVGWAVRRREQSEG